jgi:hypothetical protein
MPGKVSYLPADIGLSYDDHFFVKRYQKSL